MAGEVDVRVGSGEDGRRAEEIIAEAEGGVLINYSTSYATYVEFDTAYTSGPPLAPILKWVERKWPDLDAGLKEAGNGSKTQVASIVRNAINENGIDGIHFGARALNKMESKAPAIASQVEGSGMSGAEVKQTILGEVGNLGFAESQRIISEEATDTGNLLQSGSIEWYDDPEDIPGGED
jgi:hypothetical protein